MLPNPSIIIKIICKLSFKLTFKYLTLLARTVSGHLVSSGFSVIYYEVHIFFDGNPALYPIPIAAHLSPMFCYVVRNTILR